MIRARHTFEVEYSYDPAEIDDMTIPEQMQAIRSLAPEDFFDGYTGVTQIDVKVWVDGEGAQ